MLELDHDYIVAKASRAATRQAFQPRKPLLG